MSGHVEHLRRVASSLRFKATVGVATLLVMIAGLLTTMFVVYLERAEVEATRRLADEIGPVVARGIAPSVAAGDKEAVRHAIAPLLIDPRVQHLRIGGPGGTLARHGARPLLDIDATISRFPIRGKDGSEIGQLDLVIEPPASATGHEIRWRAVVILLATTVFGLAGPMFVLGRVLAPVQDLASATRRLAEGEIDGRLRARGIDDVAVLARNFNEMTDRLRQATTRQLEWQRELESRVEAKTREIEETRQHLSNIVENVGASILVSDLDGTIISANTHTMHIFGTKPEFTVGRNLAEFCGNEADATGVLATIVDAGGPVVSESTWHLDDSREMELLVTHTLLRDSRGEAAGILQITKDISALKGMERRLVESERMRAMGEMAGEIGHELNNYLMAIGGRAELIQAALKGSGDRRSLQKIQSSATIIADQVSEMRLLTDGLLESARKETSPRSIDLNQLVRDTIEFVKPQNKFDGIRIELDESSGALSVHADPQQIRQVVLNLLSNAAEAVREDPSRNGSIRVETFRTEDAAGLRVTDDGPGFDDSTRSRIFEPHFTTKEKGHGFGLAVCHRVVDNHGGRIEAKSRPAGGATFTVQLPVNPLRPASEAPVSP